MRLAIVIVALTAIAVTLVHIRRTELAINCQIQRLQLEQVSLRRTLWDQQVCLGRRLSPAEVRNRSDQMALDLVVPNPTQTRQSSGIARNTFDRRN